MAELPGGVVTFLFTDIEGSTRLWERHPLAMRSALARHDAIIRQAVEPQGAIFKTIGDAFCAAFSDPNAALAAALAIQLGLYTEAWGETGPLRVRLALYTTTAFPTSGDYPAPILNRVERFLYAGHGGQILLSATAADLVRGRLPDGGQLYDMGERRLLDVTQPEQIFQLLVPDLPSGFPPLRTLDAHPTNLPAHSTSLVGRKREVIAICDRLRQPGVRLLTLTGPGGSGKTRLSTQVAAEMLTEFNGGVFFVPLDRLTESGLIEAEIAATLEIGETGESLAASLRTRLRDKQMLLVLDNFEQVVEGAELLTDLLSAAPQLKILVSSRTSLHLYAEHEFAVLPLGLPPGPQLPPPDELLYYPAVALFVERAQAVKAGFQLTTKNAEAVVAICRKLDGLPLAIELAAARSKLYPPQMMLIRLSSLSFTAQGMHDRPERQRSLRGAIEWSYDLLAESERLLFARFSVFADGCTVEAAEQVCQSVAADGAGLEALADQSMLQRGETAVGEVRFAMLQTIREYAAEKLVEVGEQAATANRHAEYYLRLAETADLGLLGAEQRDWLVRLEEEHDNMRAALTHALQPGTDTTLALRLAVALWRFWFTRGHFSEGRAWLEAALAQKTTAGSSLRAKALNGAGGLAFAQSNYEQARIHYQLALALQREQGDRVGISATLNNLGSIALDEGDLATAHRLFSESLTIERQVGNKAGTAIALGNLGIVAYQLADYAAASPLLQESLALERELGNEGGIATVLGYIGLIALQQGDALTAHRLIRESLALQSSLGDTIGSLTGLDAYADLFLYLGQARLTLPLLVAISALHDSLGTPFSPTEREKHDRQLAAALARLNSNEVAAAVAEGASWTLEQAVARALEEM